MKAKLGQNFLINKKIAEKEVEYASINEQDIVLEIGPGEGVLTNLLASKAKKVIAVEIDKILVDNLKGNLPENVELINKDILKIDLKNFPKFNKVVSNLPFKISSPFTFKLLRYDFNLAILIYQKEFADRMVAKPKTENYSRLSVNVYYKAFCEKLEMVPKSCFSPQPKVDSCIIKLIPRKTPAFDVVDEKFFFDLTRNLFNFRRKKIGTVLKALYNVKYKDLPFIDKRIEELKPEQIGALSNYLYKIKL
jgi:16S rRNA (adenine1518-N6/adenine1519-N6)-dimethyltransferase